jgi:DNA-binding winged helix-turn-helix (wHTH) protein/tetratricopeptide (TPR) repeat protein
MLMNGARVVSLTPKAVETLIVLVENHGHVVSKDDLMKALWPDSFVEESNLSQNIFLLRKALGDSKEKRYILTVPGRGYQFAETVREVAQQHADEALAVESISRTQLTVNRTESRGEWLWIGLGALALILAAAGIVSYRARHRIKTAENPPVSNVKLRRSIAVLDFRNLTRQPENEWLSTALAEMLRTELAAGDQLRLVPGDQTAHGGHDISWPAAAALSKTALGTLRSSLATDYLAVGDYAVVGDGNKSRIRIDFRLLDTSGGDVLAQDTVTGNQADLFTLVFQAGSRLRETLTVAGTSTEQEDQVRASLPSNPKAARLYAEGLTRLREFEAKIAVDLLSQAVAADPKSAQARAALGLAWQALGYENKARDETQKALGLAKTLRSEEQLSVEGQYRRLNHEWPRAVEIYRALADLYPDNLDYTLQLAQTQQNSGAGNEGVATLEAARQLPPPLRNDPRIDILQAQILIDLGEFKKAQVLAAQAEDKGRQQHARLVLAQALRTHSSASLWQGQNDQARADVDEAKVLFAAAGDLRSSASAVYMNGRISYEEAKFEEARSRYEEALVVYRQIANPSQISLITETIGNVDYEEGKLQDAKRQYVEALAMYRQMDNKSGICSALGNLANTMDVLGELANAEKMQQEALQLFRDIHDQRGVGSTLNNLGNVQEEQGKLAEAEKNFQLSLDNNNKINYKAGASYPMLGLADIAFRRDDMKAARQWTEQGLAVREELHITNQAEYSRAVLAQIDIEEGRSAEAERMAIESVHNLEKADVPEFTVGANVVLAAALLANGKVEQAQSAAQRALAISAKLPGALAKFDAGIAAARADIAAGNLDAAKSRLTGLLMVANKKGYVPYIFDFRVALAEIQMKSGQTAAAKSALLSLQKEAREKGFLLVARKAAELYAPSRHS